MGEVKDLINVVMPILKEKLNNIGFVGKKGSFVSKIDDDLSGVISGAIEQTWLSLPECSDNDPDTYNAIYVFAGFNIDVDGLDMDSALYVTSANVQYNADSGNYEYEVGFVEAGDYTIALTCQTDFDRAGVNDNLVYVVSEEVTVNSDNDDDDDDDDEPDIIR